MNYTQNVKKTVIISFIQAQHLGDRINRYRRPFHSHRQLQVNLVIFKNQSNIVFYELTFLQLETVTLQILANRNNLQTTACGWFNIDMTLITKVRTGTIWLQFFGQPY